MLTLFWWDKDSGGPVCPSPSTILTDTIKQSAALIIIAFTLPSWAGVCLACMSVMQHCQSSSGSSLSPLSHNTTKAEVWGDPQSDSQWDHKSSMEAKQLLSIQPALLLHRASQSPANWELVASSAIEKLTTLHRMLGCCLLGGGRAEGGEEIWSWSWYVSQSMCDQSIKLSSWLARSSSITILDISYLILVTQVSAHTGDVMVGLIVQPIQFMTDHMNQTLFSINWSLAKFCSKRSR